MKFLIVGLGNIGAEYELTRHNIGFLALDYIADEQKTTFTTLKLGDVAEFSYKSHTITLLKPSIYMNLSGKSVNYWLQQLKISKENLLVITDDLSLPFGKIRLKPKGSAGGHNGLKHIEEVLASQDYARLRFGIGDDYPKGRQVDYVLSKFKKDEFAEMPLLFTKIQDICLSFAFIGLEKTMNAFN